MLIGQRAGVEMFVDRACQLEDLRLRRLRVLELRQRKLDVRMINPNEEGTGACVL
jgi:hypothetical protein